MPKRAAPAASRGSPARTRGRLAHPLAVAHLPPPGSMWFESCFAGKMSDEYRLYMRDEWGWEKRGDVPLFEKLCLEGAQAGLSWATILAKRQAYRSAFHNFNICRCAEMSDDELAMLVEDTTRTGPDAIVRHRGKIEAVRHNARMTLDLIAEASTCKAASPHGAFDEFLWSFVGGAPRLNQWASFKEIPTESDEGNAMSKELKRRGYKFVGPKICYSLMQSCGMVIDHPLGTPEWQAASLRIGGMPN